MSFTRFQPILAVIGFGTLVAIASIAILEILAQDPTLNSIITLISGNIYAVGAGLFSVLSVIVVLVSAYRISQSGI